MQLLPHVTPAMLDVNYWLGRASDPDAPLLEVDRLAAFNAEVPQASGVPDLFSLPDAMSADSVRDVIPLAEQCGLPLVEAHPYYDVSGQLFGAGTWQAIWDNTACDKLPPRGVAVRYGIVTHRTAIRRFPTRLAGLDEPGDLPFDQFQETTVDLGWPVAILHQSADARWLFALTPGYWGWLRADHVALAERDHVQAFAAQEPFLVVAAGWAGIALPSGGSVSAQMGTRLPLAAHGDLTHRVVVPGRELDGKLTLAEGYVEARDPHGNAYTPGWHEGYLPVTLRTIFTRAFSLLGEPYAWGGERLGRSGRDCSRLLRDVWATAGVLLPRNASQQGRVGRTVVQFDPEESAGERAAKLAASVPPGALLILPGHIMLYLGAVNGRPYAIHDLWGYNHSGGQRTIYGEVLVSDLPIEPSAKRHTLTERLTHAVVVG